MKAGSTAIRCKRIREHTSISITQNGESVKVKRTEKMLQQTEISVVSAGFTQKTAYPVGMRRRNLYGDYGAPFQNAARIAEQQDFRIIARTMPGQPMIQGR